MGSFLLRRFVDLFVIYSLLIISRNHSNTFSLLDLKNKRSKVKFWSKGYLCWYQDCARFRQVAVLYLYLVPTAAMTFIVLGDEIWSPQLHHPKFVARAFPPISCIRAFSCIQLETGRWIKITWQRSNDTTVPDAEIKLKLL